jgi:fatty-acid desaturase
MMKLSNTFKLRAFHIFNHLMMIYGLWHGEWWMWLCSFAIWNVIGTFGISIGFHRLLSHRSLKTSDRFTKISSVLGCLATGGAPLSWVGAHRMHHSGLDPHCPFEKGFFNVYFHRWGSVVIPVRFIKDLVRSPFQRFLYRYYFHFLLTWALVLYSLDPLLGFFVYSGPALLAFHSFALINTVCHRYGYRNFPQNNSATNNLFVNIISCGEGWHNNHHRYPSSYRIGLKRFEFDLSAYIIEKMRLDKSTSRAPSPMVSNFDLKN